MTLVFENCCLDLDLDEKERRAAGGDMGLGEVVVETGGYVGQTEAVVEEK